MATGACIAVAYSGGRDSTALLHATAMAARDQSGLRVFALHVHHGLSADADEWLAHAQSQCAAWAEAGLPLELRWRCLSLPKHSGDSVEALARDARYRALADMAREAGADMVLLAHHRRDQAETFLLQALRGAGTSGLAAMPSEATRDGICWVRPWLAHPRQAIEAYVARHGLHHIEDDSNADARFARNRLRLSVWPSLASAFEQAEVSLAQSASRAADARACLEVWLGQALAPLLLTEPEGAMSASALLALPLPQQRELLRHWFTTRTGRHLPASTVARLTVELPKLVDTGRSIQWRAGAFDVCLYRGVLICRPAVAPRLAAESESAVQHLTIDGPGRHALPSWGGELQVTRVTAGGVALSRLTQLEIRGREGGETFQLGPNRPARSLRKQYQAQGVPEWERQGPLLYAQGQLAFVRGLGVDARMLAAPDEPQATLIWVPDLTI